MRGQILGLVGLVVTMSCQDSGPSGVTQVPSLGASFAISEARTGGNQELFFYPPLAEAAQSGTPFFDVGGSAALQQPYLRICETNGAPGLAGCLTDVTLATTGSATGLLMTYDPVAEVYKVNLPTNQFNRALEYRLEIWLIPLASPAERNQVDPQFFLGLRDVDDSPSTAACTTANVFCFIKYGKTIPVKARIEKFAFCPTDRNCASQFVSAGQDANLQATLPAGSAATTAQFFIPGQAGTNITVAFRPCTALENTALINSTGLVTVGPCTKTVVKSPAVLGTPAVISLCQNFNPATLGVPTAQLELLKYHHWSDDLSRIQALPEDHLCGTPTSGPVASAETKGVLHFARALRDRVMHWVTPKELFATTIMIDRGGGGADPFLGTFYKLALPAKIDYVNASDASLTANAGETLVLNAKVTDFENNPVAGVRLNVVAIAVPNEGATVQGTVLSSTPVYTNSLGIAQATVMLNQYRGYNVFTFSQRGVADNRESGCIVPPSTASSCNGPRPAFFDPFTPYQIPEFDAPGSGVESPVEVPTGSRLKFTIFGRGQPAP